MELSGTSIGALNAAFIIQGDYRHNGRHMVKSRLQAVL